jgi:hypothetical protein
MLLKSEKHGHVYHYMDILFKKFEFYEILNT